MDPKWKNLILTIVAAIAATVYGLLVPLKPPFDEVTFVNLVLWLVEVILVAVGV